MTVATPVLSMAESISADADVGRALEAHESIMTAMAGLAVTARSLTVRGAGDHPDPDALIGRKRRKLGGDPLVPPAGFEPALPA